MSRALREIPAVRELAERQASECAEAIRTHHGLMSDHTEAAMFAAHVDLLCDLTRPASRDAVARLVAESVDRGAVSLNAPSLYCVAKIHARNADGWELGGIIFHDSPNLLRSVEKARELAARDYTAEPWLRQRILRAAVFVGMVNAGRIRHVRGLYAAMPHAEALALIADAVLP